MKAKRLPLYIGYKQSVASEVVEDVVALNADPEKVCHTCGNDFDRNKHARLVLDCCRRKICRYCYLSWCEKKGPAGADCFYCCKAFFDFDEVHTMKFGLFQHIYELTLMGNQKFNDWVNF